MKKDNEKKQKAIEDHIKAWEQAGWPYTVEELKELEHIYDIKVPKWALEKAQEREQ
jgi:ribosome-binding protein aMBF1 (putative translation factor)